MTAYNKHAKRSHNSHKSTKGTLMHYKVKAHTAKKAVKKQQITKAWGHQLSGIFRAMLPSREND